MSSKRQLFRGTMIVGFFSFLGSLTGILVETSIAAKLGLSKSSDTFYVAFTMPYVVTNLLSATGQISLVPFFGTLEARNSEEELWRGLSYAINIIFLGLGGIALLGAAFSPWIVRGIAPGFTAEQSVVAARLTRWLFLIILPAGVAEVFRSFLLSRRHYALPSAAGFIRNTVVIVSILGAFTRWNYYSIVLGYLGGYTLQLFILGAQIVLAFPARYSLALRGTGEAFRNLRGAGSAQLGGAMAWQIVVVVERIIASFLPAGTLTALNYGLKIMSTLAELLAGSVGTVALPALSRAVAHQAREEERKIFRDTLELALMFVLPVIVFCSLLNHNIIRLFFQRGRFTPESTALLATVFLYYSLGLLPYSFTRIFTFYLFARHESGLFLRFAVFVFGLTLVFDLIYVAGFGMGAIGIPLGLLTAYTLTLLLAYQRNLADLQKVFGGALAWFTIKNVLGGLLAALVILGLRPYFGGAETSRANFLALCILCGAGSIAYFFVLAATRAVPVAEILVEFQRGDEA